MFGIIYTLLAIGTYVKGIFKAGAHDAESTSRAIEAGKSTYIDYRGNRRDVVSNEKVLFKIDPYTGDSGYEIIDPRSARRGEFINTDEEKRNVMWREQNKAWFTRRAIAGGNYTQPVTVIEWEKRSNKKDSRSFMIGLSAAGTPIYSQPRACRGLRYKDIETGRLFVKREMSFSPSYVARKTGKSFLYDVSGKRRKNGGRLPKFEYYMDAETGMAVRLTDEQIKRNVNGNASDCQQMLVEMQNFNRKQEANLINGLNVTKPDLYYVNARSI